MQAAPRRFAPSFDKRLKVLKIGQDKVGKDRRTKLPDVTAEFFWRDRWWNVIAGYRPDSGALTGYYCNVAKTPLKVEVKPDQKEYKLEMYRRD